MLPVSKSPRHRVMCANKFALQLPFLSWCAKKFALHDQNMRITVFSAVLGELFRGAVAEWAVLGEVFRGSAAEEPLNAFTVSVRMRVGSPCGHRSSVGDQFRMQFPSRYFKL